MALTYALSSTDILTYPLDVKLTPACGYTHGGWVVSATGVQPANFQNINAGGAYIVGPTTTTN